MKQKLAYSLAVFSFLALSQVVKATHFNIKNNTLYNAHIKLIQRCTMTHNFNHTPQLTGNAQVDIAPGTSTRFEIISGAGVMSLHDCNGGPDFATISIVAKDQNGQSYRSGLVWVMNRLSTSGIKIYVNDRGKFLHPHYDKKSKIYQVELSF